MSMRTILRRFVEMMENPFFAEYEKDFSRRLCSALANGYRQSYDEPELVEQMVTSVNSISLSDPTKPLGISTSGVFIHGNIALCAYSVDLLGEGISEILQANLLFSFIF